MRATNDDYKPSLFSEEELAHYGVKGMKWGVRRDRKALDRAAGRTPPKGRGRGPAIRDARREASDASRSLSKANKDRKQKAKVAKAISPDSPAYKQVQSDLKKAERKFEKERQEFLDNPARAASARVTYGEAAALAVLLSPLGAAVYAGGITVAGRTAARNQRERAAAKS